MSTVDSELARESNVGVQEMINGCMCCVLVGQMKLALLELKGMDADVRSTGIRITNDS
jgi:G3E family GTPase